MYWVFIPSELEISLTFGKFAFTFNVLHCTNLRAQLCTTDTTNFWILTNKDLGQVLDASQAWKWQPKTLKRNPNVRSFAQSSPATQMCTRISLVWCFYYQTKKYIFHSYVPSFAKSSCIQLQGRKDLMGLYFFVEKRYSLRDIWDTGVLCSILHFNFVPFVANVLSLLVDVFPRAMCAMFLYGPKCAMCHVPCAMCHVSCAMCAMFL